MVRNDLIDAYVAAVRNRLVWRRDVDDIADELDDHLRSAADSLVEQGVEPISAQHQVLDRFGDPASVSMSFVSTGSRGLALPTEFTRTAGVFGIVSAVAWCAVALAVNGSYLAERAIGSWEGPPQILFMMGAGADTPSCQIISCSASHILGHQNAITRDFTDSVISLFCCSRIRIGAGSTHAGSGIRRSSCGWARNHEDRQGMGGPTDWPAAYSEGTPRRVH